MAKYVRDKYTLTQNDKIFRWYRDNPAESIKDILKVNPIWFQRIQMKELWNKNFCVLNWGRGTSKTFTLSLFAALYAMMIPKVQIGIIAPSMRQATYIFENLNKIRDNSEFFRASLTGEKNGISQYLKTFGNRSTIEALPLGDGSNVRGRRYNVVILDEYAQIANNIIESVIRPMLSVKLAGIDNKIISSSTAYWKFNHYWKLYKDYRDKMKQYPNEYSVTEFDFRDVNDTVDSPFSIDMKMVEEARATSPREIFEMEWMSIFPSEISAFFSPRLIDSCTPKAPKSEPVEIETKAIGGSYVLGIDPMEGQGANFGITIMKCVNGIRKIVRVITIPADKFSFPLGAKTIRELVKVYDIERINMDSRGGGRALEDLLSQEYTDENGNKHKPILNIDDEKTAFKDGIKILRMIKFSTEKVHSLYMNFKADMQSKLIEFPLDLCSDPDQEIEKAYREIIQLKREMLVLQAKSRGVYLYFDVPSGFKKDRISSAVLANDAMRDIFAKTEEVQSVVVNKGFFTGGWL